MLASWRARLLSVVLVLPVATGINICLDVANSEYVCSPGTTDLDFQGCALTDADFSDLEACFDSAGRSNVERVNVLETELTTMPEGIFAGCTGLIYLYIHDNPMLTALPAGLFSGLPVVKFLSLGANALTSFPSGLFSGLTSLTSLHLSENPLEGLSEGLFSDLTLVDILNLMECGLTSLPAGAFVGMTELQFLHLADNEFTTLPSTVFSDLPRLRHLNLLGNDDLQCVPANSAEDVVVSSDDIRDGICGCSPVEAVFCDAGVLCSAGSEGHTCGDGALVEAGDKTTVTTWVTAYDETVGPSGCWPSGCTAELTRDSNLSPNSRWSCEHGLENAPCEIWYIFEVPQDIVTLKMAFYLGDRRTRSFSVTTFNNDDDSHVTYEFTSSGDRLGYDTFELNSDETYKLQVTPSDPNYYDWFSVTETRFMVLV